jgi:hypothetical protein
MSPAVEALNEQSRRLLTAIRTGATSETLSDLMNIREERIHSLGVALADGEAMGAEDVDEMRNLEREIMDSLIRDREAVQSELAALHHSRWAGSVYRAEGEGPCRYIDRAG